VELEEFFKAGPENDADLTEVAVESSAAAVREGLLIFLVDCKHQQHCVQIKSAAYCLLEVVEEEL